MIKIRNHERKEIEFRTKFIFKNIEELSEQIIDSAICLFERAYSKDSMTNNEIPVVHLLKALIKIHKNDEDNNIPDAKYLELVFEQMLIDFEKIEQNNAKY